MNKVAVIYAPDLPADFVFMTSTHKVIGTGENYNKR
jgi:hypothetical protein